MSRRSFGYDVVALYASGALWNICMGMLQVLVPLYALSLGFSIVKISSLVSLRALGPLIIGLVLASFITISRQKKIYTLGMAGLGFFLMATGWARDFLPLAFVIVGLGASGGFMDLLYQVEATEFSKAGDRSVAMASAGLGWILCPLITPMVAGWLAQSYGFQFAFCAAGLFFLLIAAGTRLWHRLLAPAEAREKPTSGSVLG